MSREYTEQQLRTTLFSTALYKKYRLDDGTRNPQFDAASKHILNLKDPAHPQYAAAIEFYKPRLIKRLSSLIDRDDNFVAAIVPSHERDSLSKGLTALFQYAKDENFAIVNKRFPLRRHTTIAKLSSGGDRSIDVHLNSIEVIDSHAVGAQTVVLLDDVATTHNSIKACRKLLENAGAELVICVALAHTSDS